MAITAHAYQIYIAAPPDVVWTAITESDWTRRWFFATAFVEEPVEGRRYQSVGPDGKPAVEGVVEVLAPRGPNGPGRFVQTWRVLHDTAMAQEPPSRVEWSVEEAGPGLTRVRLVHGDLAGSPRTWAHARDRWVWALDSLKTVLETGRPLPPPVGEPPAVDPAGDATWHRRQGVAAHNATWDLLGRSDRDADEDEDLLRSAYASAYHWDRAAGAGPANAARAAYLVAKALLGTGRPVAALASAERVLELCRRHGLVDFDLAYGHEARARALAALGRTEESATAWAAARAVEVADEEDRAVVAADFADQPG